MVLQTEEAGGFCFCFCFCLKWNLLLPADGGGLVRKLVQSLWPLAPRTGTGWRRLLQLSPAHPGSPDLRF